MKTYKISICLFIIYIFFPKDLFNQFKYGPIINKEPGKVFVNDIVLNANPDFDPLNVKEVMFKAPTLEHPYYHLIVPVKDFTGGKPVISSVLINGELPDFYFTYVNGQLHVENWLAQKATTIKNIVIVMKYTWHNNQKYKIEIKLRAPKVFDPESEKDYLEETTTHNVISPGKGGAPDNWKYSIMIVLQEEYGLKRIAEPVDLALCIKQSRVKNLKKEVRVMEYNPATQKFNEIPSQTYGFQTYSGRGLKQGRLHEPSYSCRVVFLADVLCCSKKMYAIVYGNPEASVPQYTSDLQIKGSGPGAVIENEYWKVKLHEKSGQIHYYRLKKTDGKNIPDYSNTTSGSVHWNPDTYGENGSWGHTFSWNPPENIYEVARGPLMYKITRSGRMPGNPEVFTSVTYTFFAGSPYILMSSIMEITHPYAASAIRNGEMVFDADIFDHYAWKAKNGERRFLRTLLNPDEGFDAPAMIPIDTPWLCLYNSQGKYAMGAIHLNVYNFNKIDGVSATYRPKFFLYCHPQWGRPLTYFVRTLVYPFGYNFRGPAMYIPAGNVYVEQGAYFPFLLGKKDPFEPIEILNDKLKHPLEIRYGN
ncbi:hypothetical protein DRQ09_03235 [candidate division KSB1 bacterium]|nr:MAG: hypothetical protein DRQ09_03235 [candidate division KSB1 bacterium]